MKVLRVRNVNDALPQGMALLKAEGIREDSRAGPVLVLPYPVTTVYERPQERVLFSPTRDANPFFHVAEALWMLSGRRDAKWLNQFVRDFGDRFAEPDGCIHDAYGYRWRKHFDMEGGGSKFLPDQLDTIVKLLKKNPQDRQAVLTMWDPAADLGVPGLRTRPCNTHIYFRIRREEAEPFSPTFTGAPEPKLDITVCCRSNDIIWGAYGANACLSGETKLVSPEGDLSVKELASRFRKGLRRYPVYSFNQRSKDFNISWCNKVWSVGKKRVIKIGFDDGSYVKCTGDHKFFRKKWNNNQYCVEVPALDLRVGDRVWATQIWSGEDGRKSIKRNLAIDTNYSNMVRVARAYYAFRTGEEIEPGFDIHHVDENKTNDSFVNLEKLIKSEHRRYHILKKHPMDSGEARKRASESRKRYFENMTEEELEAYCEARRNKVPTAETLKLISDAHKKIWDEKTPEEKKEQLDRLHASPSPRFTGKKHSLETKRLQSEARTRYWKNKRSEQSNHKIISTEELGVEEVYDFSVPGDNNAMLENGVFVHNCHFSVLQEYTAARIGVGIGTYFQFSHNYHAYCDIFEKMLPVLDEPPMGYVVGIFSEMVGDPESFDDDLARFMDWSECGDDEPLPKWYPRNPWLEYTASPLLIAHRFWKQKDREHALEVIENAERMAIDWKLAAKAWMRRRMK